jgi:hypothetical protein
VTVLQQRSVAADSSQSFILLRLIVTTVAVREADGCAETHLWWGGSTRKRSNGGGQRATGTGEKIRMQGFHSKQIFIFYFINFSRTLLGVAILAAGVRVMDAEALSRRFYQQKTSRITP